MKLKLKKPLNLTHAGFTFRNGIANVAPEEEAKARRISRLLDYEIVEDEVKEAPKKAPAKPKAKPKAAAKEKTEAKK